MIARFALCAHISHRQATVKAKDREVHICGIDSHQIRTIKADLKRSELLRVNAQRDALELREKYSELEGRLKVC